MAKAGKSSAKKTATRDKMLTIDYVKSNFFRVIHSDGAWGGLSPRGDAIQMYFWSERPAIPQEYVHTLTDRGIGEEIKQKRKVRSNLVREVEAGVVMSKKTAIVFRDWLNEKIDLANQVEDEVSRGESSEEEI